jgi:hypothetical protein
LRTSSSLSTTAPSAPPWRGSRTGTTRSGRTRLWAARHRMRSSIDDDLSTAAGASSRGPGTQRRASVRRHGRRPGPRLERDSTSWPRRSEARAIWRRSRSDGATDWCGTDTVAAQGDVCLTSQRSVEWRASGIAETSKARPQVFSASRSGLEPRAQTWLPSAGDCRWTTTPEPLPPDSRWRTYRWRGALRRPGHWLGA